MFRGFIYEEGQAGAAVGMLGVSKYGTKMGPLSGEASCWAPRARRWNVLGCGTEGQWSARSW